MDFDKEFKKPFDKEGEPNKYLRLLIPLIEKEYARKEEMLKLMGVDIVSNPAKRNTHASTISKLSKLGIVDVKARGNGNYRRGENWYSFMGWLTMHILNNPRLQTKFKNMLIRYDTNAMEYILKDDEGGYGEEGQKTA